MAGNRNQQMSVEVKYDLQNNSNSMTWLTNHDVPDFMLWDSGESCKVVESLVG